MDITAFGHPNGFVPGGKVFVDSSKELLAIAKKFALNQNLRVIGGIIATGAQFVH